LVIVFIDVFSCVVGANSGKAPDGVVQSKADSSVSKR
jgi:hypothetical protein